jgi:dTMP kinase
VTEHVPLIGPVTGPVVPDDATVAAASRHILRNRSFLRLWAAQVVSSTGDWIGLIAILALANHVAGSGTGVGLVMTARLLPGFILAPFAGALLDRWDRRRVMVVCDIGRGCLLAMLPFFHTILGLVLISFALEVLSLLWTPAKDASVPNVVREDQLASANSLGLAAAWGTFPLGAIFYTALAGFAKWLGGFAVLDRFHADQASLAIWVDSLTFVTSAMLIMRLHLPEQKRGSIRRIDWTQTYRDMLDGLRFIRSEALVRGVMIGIAGGLLGGGVMVPLGPVFSKQVLGAGDAGFGVLMIALGIGAAIGGATLIWLQRRFNPERMFVWAVLTTGVALIVTAFVSTLTPATFLVALVGAAAVAAYVTGFTVLQANVSDDLRGRIFAALYTIVRLCLLLSMTIGPFVATTLDAISRSTIHRRAHVGDVGVALPGVRLALIAGGAIIVASAFAARRRIHRAHAEAAMGGGASG